ncbi:MAG: PorT family protein [Bacteroidetes bacterium]|nr:MAG: PorT family protein [Bacteroidota bacterium]
MKNLILFLLIVVCATSVQAQFSGIGFRPVLSLSAYKLSKDYNDIYDVSLRPGGGAAIFAEFNLGNRLTFQPEIAFMQRGGNIKSESNIFWDGQDFGYPRDYIISQIRQKETLHYLDIPMMFEKNFGGGNVGFYVALGPAFSFAISNGKGLEEITVEHLNSEGETVTFTDRTEYSIEMGSGRNDDYRKYDFSVNFGTGLMFILERGEISFDFRYSHGMRSVDVSGLKNRNLQFGLSYMYYFAQ